MNIDQVMNTTVRTCRPEDAGKRAAQLMWDHDIGCVPVIDGNKKPIAMVTDRDLLMSELHSGKNLDQLMISEAMSKQLFVARQGDSIQVASDLMRLRQIRRLPVVDGSGRLVGIVSLNDLALAGGRNRELKAEDVAKTLASICQPRTPPAQAQHRV